MRATVTTTVPNFARGATIPITLSVVALKDHMSLGDAAELVGVAIYGIALLSALYIQETFAADPEYLEK